MLDVLCTSTFPPGAAGLAILLKEKSRKEAIDVYLGDLIWSILGSLHRLGGGDLRAPSYSSVFKELDGNREEKPKLQSNDFVRSSLKNTFQKYGIEVVQSTK